MKVLIYDKYQSGFQKLHSTQTALLKDANDIQIASNTGDCSILVLLDLSSAFDTVAHHILIHRLRNCMCMSGSALHWFSSYSTDRGFAAPIGGFVSSQSHLSWGGSTGLCSGPSTSYHLYADDIQLYFTFKAPVSPGPLLPTPSKNR